jgi:glycosyltransferase involved in cell wall biosynthesis
MPLQDVLFQAGVTTILEAMSMGKPVICSRSRGQQDVIDDGTTGVYVPPGDPVLLRAALDEVLAAPARAAEMGAAAREYAVRECDVAIYARRLAAVVDEVIDRRAATSVKCQT